MDRIKAVALATGLSVLPAKEVGSGISYGGSVGIDFNRNVSIGGQILSVNKPNSVYGKLGANLILIGKDKGGISIRGGAGYLLNDGFSLGVEGGYNPKSKSPFSLGIGGGYGVVKDEKNGRGENGGVENVGLDYCSWTNRADKMLGNEEICKERCINSGGTWTNGYCECSRGKSLGVSGGCSRPF